MRRGKFYGMEDRTRSDNVKEWKLIEIVICGLPHATLDSIYRKSLQINRVFSSNLSHQANDSNFLFFDQWIRGFLRFWSEMCSTDRRFRTIVESHLPAKEEYAIWSRTDLLNKQPVWDWWTTNAHRRFLSFTYKLSLIYSASKSSLHKRMKYEPNFIYLILSIGSELEKTWFFREIGFSYLV